MGRRWTVGAGRKSGINHKIGIGTIQLPEKSVDGLISVRRDRGIILPSSAEFYKKKL